MANVRNFLSFEFDKDDELEVTRRLEKPVFQSAKNVPTKD